VPAVALALLASQGLSALRRLNAIRGSLSADDYTRVKAELAAAASASGDVKAALRAALRDRDRRRSVDRYVQARAAVLNPSPEAVAFRKLFDRVHTSESVVFRNVYSYDYRRSAYIGATPHVDYSNSLVGRTLRWASAQAFLTPPTKTDDERVTQVRSAIRAVLLEQGILSLSDLSQAINGRTSPSPDPDNGVFLAALHLEVETGGVIWTLKNDAYKTWIQKADLQSYYVHPDRVSSLGEVQPPVDAVDSAEETLGLKVAIARLVTSTTALADAVGSSRSNLSPTVWTVEPEEDGAVPSQSWEELNALLLDDEPTEGSLEDGLSEAISAFSQAWLMVLGPSSHATRAEIEAFVRSDWASFDSNTRSWIPDMPRIWRPVAERWDVMSPAERNVVLEQWRPIFKAFDNRLVKILR
jgi:hypothetical protein